MGVSKSVVASGSRDGCILRCSFGKKSIIGLRPRYLRVLDGGAIRAAACAANVDLGTHLLISSQAASVPMDETLVLGVDDWM